MRYLLMFLAWTTLTIGCSDDEEPNVTPKVEDTNHAYMGSWSGTFDGGDSGTWTMECDKDGNFMGSFMSGNSGTNYSIDSGFVDDMGKFSAQIYIGATKIDFIGQGVNGDSASGTWGNSTAMIDGTWSGSKQ